MTAPALDAIKLDPFADVKVGDYLEGKPNYRDREVGARVGGRYDDNVCRAEAGGYYCTRPAGHPAYWDHIAIGDGAVKHIWGKEPLPLPLLEDPDGPAEDAPVGVPVEIGNTYRLRHKANSLYVVGGIGGTVRKDGKIEVLDLHHRRFRLVGADEIAVHETGSPTTDEFLWVVEWIAGQRADTRDVAIQKYHEGRWCEAGMQDALRDLALEKYAPTLHGNVTITLEFTAPNELGRRPIQDKVLALVNTDEFRAVFAPLATTDGLELAKAAPTVRAGDFWRK